MTGALELGKRSRLFVLDIAERGEDGEIVRVRTLPRLVVAGAEAEGILRRSRIRKQRNGIVRPNAGLVQTLPPGLDVLSSIARRVEEVRLDERYAALRVHEAL